MVFCHGCLEDIEDPENNAADFNGGMTFHKTCAPDGFNQGVPEWVTS